MDVIFSENLLTQCRAGAAQKMQKIDISPRDRFSVKTATARYAPPVVRPRSPAGPAPSYPRGCPQSLVANRRTGRASSWRLGTSDHVILPWPGHRLPNVASSAVSRREWTVSTVQPRRSGEGRPHTNHCQRPPTNHCQRPHTNHCHQGPIQITAAVRGSGW